MDHVISWTVHHAKKEQIFTNATISINLITPFLITLYLRATFIQLMVCKEQGVPS